MATIVLLYNISILPSFNLYLVQNRKYGTLHSMYHSRCCLLVAKRCVKSMFILSRHRIRKILTLILILSNRDTSSLEMLLLKLVIYWIKLPIIDALFVSKYRKNKTSNKIYNILNMHYFKKAGYSLIVSSLLICTHLTNNVELYH